MKAVTARHGRRHPDGSRDVVVRQFGQLVARVRQLALPVGAVPARRPQARRSM